MTTWHILGYCKKTEERQGAYSVYKLVGLKIPSRVKSILSRVNRIPSGVNSILG